MKFYSNGKILLTAEYLVLHGATALAMPVRFGQSLDVLPLPSVRELHWESTVMGGFWFQAGFLLPSLEIKYTNDQGVATRLQQMLIAAQQLAAGFLSDGKGYMARANINFNRFWGLGTSSSLVSNIAAWAGTDPYELHGKVSKGSGFDIACARSQSPLFFTVAGGKPEVNPVGFCPAFRDSLYFVYLGQKQDSESSVRNYLLSHPPGDEVVNRITELTRSIYATADLETFNSLIREHESLIASVTGLTSPAHTLFSGFRGGVKSLGAWGGDFVLLTWDGSFTELESWLRSKDLYTVIPFSEMVLKPQTAET